jgi:hypothetical protein
VRYFKAVYAQMRTGEQAKAALETCIRRFNERRIRSTDIFRGYDKLNKGYISRSAFIRGLGGSMITGLTLSDMEALADGYADIGADASGQFTRWRDFCDDIEAAMYLRPTLLPLEQNPLAANSTFAQTIMSRPPQSEQRPELPEQTRVKLHAAMSDIRGAVQRYRTFRIVDMLGDFDPRHEGHVTADRFLRVLAMCSCAPHRNDDRDILLHYYKGVGAKSELINYRGFVTDLDLKSLGFLG